MHYGLLRHSYDICLVVIRSIGVVPIIKYGSEYLVENFAKPCIFGDKRFALAISEPYAGSDVNAIHTKATMHEDGNWRVRCDRRNATHLSCTSAEGE